MGLGFPEFGRLRRVLMHAPGKEIEKITPAAFGRYLFEDAIDPREFRSQHERLVDLLRGEGVTVELIGALLRGSPLVAAIETSPNLVYTRDTVTVTRAGALAMRMKGRVRGREPRLAWNALAKLDVHGLAAIRSPATMEGGDLMFLDESTLLVGVGNRTTMAAVRQVLAKGEAHGLDTLVAVQLPNWVIHLDGTMMIIDRDLALVHRDALRRGAIVLRRGRPAKRTEVLTFLKRRGFRFIDVTAYERRRRATNVITLGPRKVIGYAGNSRVRMQLEAADCEVLEIEGSELVRGGGGPRCMTAPIERESAPGGAGRTPEREAF